MSASPSAAPRPAVLAPIRAALSALRRIPHAFTRALRAIALYFLGILFISLSRSILLSFSTSAVMVYAANAVEGVLRSLATMGLLSAVTALFVRPGSGASAAFFAPYGRARNYVWLFCVWLLSLLATALTARAMGGLHHLAETQVRTFTQVLPLALCTCATDVLIFHVLGSLLYADGPCRLRDVLRGLPRKLPSLACILLLARWIPGMLATLPRLSAGLSFSALYSRDALSLILPGGPLHWMMIPDLLFWLFSILLLVPGHTAIAFLYDPN